MNYNKEIWKPVKTFEEKCEVSNYGRVRNKKTNHIYKSTNQFGDYFRIILYDKGHKKTYLIHRLVAETFIPNPKKYICVNHKDCNKQNNCVDNLEWCTLSYNSKHAYINGTGICNGINKYNKNKCYEKYGIIYQYDKNMKLIGKFKSVKMASEKTGVCSRNILQCINNEPKRKSAGGFIWKSEVVENGL